MAIHLTKVDFMQAGRRPYAGPHRAAAPRPTFLSKLDWRRVPSSLAKASDSRICAAISDAFLSDDGARELVRRCSENHHVARAECGTLRFAAAFVNCRDSMKFAQEQAHKRCKQI